MTWAYLEYTGFDDKYTDSSVEYRVTLYKDGIFDTKVGSYTGCADDNMASLEFDVEQGKDYYFVIDVLDPNFNNGPLWLCGLGRVTDVTVN